MKNKKQREKLFQYLDNRDIPLEEKLASRTFSHLGGYDFGVISKSPRASNEYYTQNGKKAQDGINILFMGHKYDFNLISKDLSKSGLVGSFLVRSENYATIELILRTGQIDWGILEATWDMDFGDHGRRMALSYKKQQEANGKRVLLSEHFLLFSSRCSKSAIYNFLGREKR